MHSQIEGLDGYPVVISIPLQWGDQDCLGHVNNVVYLRWAETARVQYLRQVNLWDGSGGARVGPILANIRCDYRIPLTYPDTVHVGARVTAIGNASLKVEHRIVSANHGAVAAEVESTLVYVDYRARKSVRLPEEMRRAVEKLEGRDFGA